MPLEPHRAGVATQPALVALPVPAPYGDYRTIVDWRIEESLPKAIAAFVAWLVRDSGWTGTERERPDEPVPIEPRHVCVLFRRFRTFGGDATRPYVRELEARRLPHVLLGGSSFHVREEVEAIRNALMAVERPEDELMVYATLRGPVFALMPTPTMAPCSGISLIRTRTGAAAAPAGSASMSTLALSNRPSFCSRSWYSTISWSV